MSANDDRLLLFWNMIQDSDKRLIFCGSEMWSVLAPDRDWRVEPHETQTRALGPATRHRVVHTHAVFGPQTAAFAGKYVEFLLFSSSYFDVLYKSTIDLYSLRLLYDTETFVNAWCPDMPFVWQMVDTINSRIFTLVYNTGNKCFLSAAQIEYDNNGAAVSQPRCYLHCNWLYAPG